MWDQSPAPLSAKKYQPMTTSLMSILNAHIARDRALVCTDTLLWLEGDSDPGAYRHGSKAFVLAHANAVCAGRGSHLALLTIWASLAALPASDFDSLAGAFTPALGEAAFGLHAKWRADQGIPAELPAAAAGMSALLVGWSEAAGRMVGIKLNRCPDSHEWTMRHSDAWGPWTCAPWEPELGPSVPPLSTVEEMLDCAAQQLKWSVDNAHPASLSSRVVLTELERDRMTISRRLLVPGIGWC